MTTPLFRIALALPALALTACVPSLKSTFIDQSYPRDVEPVPQRDLELSVDAAIAPWLTVAFDRPGEVGACMQRVGTPPEAIDAMWAYGMCRADGAPMAECAPRLPWIRPEAGSASPRPGAPGGSAGRYRIDFGCPSQLGSERDRLRLALALADGAEAVVSYHLGQYGQAARGGAMPPPLREAFKAAVVHAAALTSASPIRAADAKLPALALSGGAANGAFISGYVYGLLWLRERAHLYANEAQRAELDRYRFGSVFSSSVGTLVSLPLDLYHVEREPTPAERQALSACIEDGGGPVTALPDRMFQDCSLAKLQADFVKNEWDLLCAQHGSALSLVEDDFSGVLRFDPLERDTVVPFLRTFGPALTQNAFVRTSMASELLQHVLVGLDERACLLPGMPVERCLTEAVMSSIVEPVFVPPRDRVYSGLRGPKGETGHWLDGSVRSINPSARAATYTLGKVLVVGTSRAGAHALTPPKGAMPLILDSMNEFAYGQGLWELGAADGYRVRERGRGCTLGALVGDAASCATAPGDAGYGGLGGDIMPVWVPEDLSPQRFVASGYTFDPVVMRGLFLWGKREAFRSRSALLGFLEWCALEAMVDPGAACETKGFSPALAKDLAEHSGAIDDEIALLQKYDDASVWKSHVAERRAEAQRKLRMCD